MTQQQNAPAAHGTGRIGPRAKKFALLAVLAAAASGAAWVALSQTSGGAAQAPAAEQAIGVTAAAAIRVRWPAIVEAAGGIVPWQEAIVGAQVAGLRLDEVRVNVGDTVRRGEVLARFDADLLHAEEAQLQAAWSQAEANRQRALQLKGSGGISEQEILQYVTQAETARAQLEAKRVQLRYARVLAPDDGVVSARSATVGAVATSGQELFRMIRQNRLEWRGELTAVQLARVSIGQRVGLALPDGGAARAVVRRIAPALDPQTRLGIVYADLEAGSRARAGMYANGRIVLAESAAIVAPAISVVIRDGQSYVLKLQGRGAVHRVALQAVTVGRRQGAQVEIVSGLAAGDAVVEQGAGFLNDGDTVRVLPTPEAAKG